MKALILTIALASGAWLMGGPSAAASDFHLVRGGYGGHGGHYHGGHHHHHYHGHHGHWGGGHYYGGYPHYGGAYYSAPYYHSPYGWQTPYYGFRLYGRNFSFNYGY
jgi:hypothetical protein